MNIFIFWWNIPLILARLGRISFFSLELCMHNAHRRVALCLTFSDCLVWLPEPGERSSSRHLLKPDVGNARLILHHHDEWVVCRAMLAIMETMITTELAVPIPESIKSPLTLKLQSALFSSWIYHTVVRCSGVPHYLYLQAWIRDENNNKAWFLTFNMISVSVLIFLQWRKKR